MPGFADPTGRFYGRGILLSMPKYYFSVRSAIQPGQALRRKRFPVHRLDGRASLALRSAQPIEIDTWVRRHRSLVSHSPRQQSPADQCDRSRKARDCRRHKAPTADSGASRITAHGTPPARSRPPRPRRPRSAAGARRSMGERFVLAILRFPRKSNDARIPPACRHFNATPSFGAKA